MPMYRNWGDSTPEFFEPPIYLRQIRADVENGTFLLVQATEDAPEFLGRLIKHTNNHCEEQSGTTSIVLNAFEKVSSFEGTLPVVPIDSGAAQGVCEVVQTRNFNEFIIDNLFLVEVAFVFTLDNMDSGLATSCAGITNAFLCRYRIHDGCIEPCTFVPFPSQQAVPVNVFRKYDSCYPSRLWTSMMLLQDIMVKGLNRYSERQGAASQFRLSTSFSQESWAYLCRRTKTAGLPMHRTRRQTRRRLLPDMKMQSFRITRTMQFVRFETEEQLDVFRSTVGATSTYGIRKRFAAIEAPPNFVQQNDAMNVVVGSHNIQQPFRVRTHNNGIDLFYDSVQLTVSIRYERYLYRKTANGALEQCPSLHLEGMLRKRRSDESEDDDSCIMNIGNIFQHDGLLVKICRISCNDVECLILSPLGRRGEVVQFDDKAYVERCIVEYTS